MNDVRGGDRVVGTGAARDSRPRVTSLAPDPRQPGAVRIDLAGTRFGSVPAELIKAEGLAVGVAPSGETLARLGAAADLEAAYRTVLDSLSRRAYARADLGRRLVRRGHPRGAVDAALDRAEANGFLDDEGFAVYFVQTRAKKGRGPARLRRDLVARGIDRALIDRVVAAEWPAFSDADPSAVPMALATKRAAALGELPKPVKRRRILAFLARRGFTGHEAVEVVAKAVP